MGGFSSNTSGQDVVFAKNIDLSGGAIPGDKILTNGQLLIGSTALNAGGTHINVGNITSPDSSLTIGYSAPNITIVSPFKLADVTITATQMKNLFTVPFTLIAAQGAGNIIVVYSALFILDFNTTPYDIGATGGLDMEYNSNSNYSIQLTAIDPTFLSNSDDQTVNIYARLTNGNNTEASNMVNQPITLVSLSGNLALGDSPVRVKLIYQVQATGL